MSDLSENTENVHETGNQDEEVSEEILDNPQIETVPHENVHDDSGQHEVEDNIEITPESPQSHDVDATSEVIQKESSEDLPASDVMDQIEESDDKVEENVSLTMDETATSEITHEVDEILEEEAEQQEQEEEEQQEGETYNREMLLQQYKELVEERSKLQRVNQQYQNRLAEYFRKKKSDEKDQEVDKNVTDQEQRYMKYMSTLEELQNEAGIQAANMEVEMKDLKDKCQEKLKKAEEASEALIEFKYNIGKSAVNSRTGKHIPQKDLEQIKVSEAKKEQEVVSIRLENIKLKNRLKKNEIRLKAKEELAEGLHLIDFEQLKIENQTYNEKIEERNEELLKLRRKVTTTVQVMTHLKEKLQFVQGENFDQRARLSDIEVTVAQRRDILTRMKQVRDALRTDNVKLKHRSGLLGNKPLLKDYELRKEESEKLRAKIAILKEQHVELSLNLNALRLKVEKTDD